MDTIKITISGPQASGKTLLANLITKREGEVVTALEGSNGLYTARRTVRAMLKGRAEVVIETTNEPERKPPTLADYRTVEDPEAVADAERWARPHVTQTGRLSVNTGPTTKSRASKRKLTNHPPDKDRRFEGLIGNLLIPNAPAQAAEIFSVAGRAGWLRVKVWSSHTERQTGQNGALLAMVKSEHFHPLPYRLQDKATKLRLREGI
jgi:hypothetical protein